MKAILVAAMRLEAQQLARDKAYVLLTIVAAVSLLVLLSMFGLTASDVPMALVIDDRGPYARPFVESLVEVPHAFRFTRMTPERAEDLMRTGDIVGVIRIPKDFSREITSGGTVAIEVELDNVNVDIVADVQRSLPSAIVSFGHKIGLPGLRVRLVEHDVWPRDTSFLPYITVSGLGLVSFIIASVLGALSIAREWERRTWRVWRLSPAKPALVLAGKLLTNACVSLVAIALAALVVVFAYGAVPARPLSAILGIVTCVACFTCVGACIGALVRRSLVLVPLLFGLAMPLFIDSGALEPTRFDGEGIWALAHLTPLYYAVGWLEWSFFGLVITPEPSWSLLVVLLALGVVSFALARRIVTRWSATREHAT